MPSSEARVVSSDSVRRAIVDAARQQAVDLLVLGVHDRHWWAFVAATAEEILQDAPCDLLVVRAG